jgi:hypothetical protein
MGREAFGTPCCFESEIIDYHFTVAHGKRWSTVYAPNFAALFSMRHVAAPL